MTQSTFNDGAALSVARTTINDNANDAESRMSTQKVVKSLADLSAFLVGSTYELPANKYLFDNKVDFGTADIDLIDANSVYIFESKNFFQTDIATPELLIYSGTTPFITTSATGVSLDIIRCTITTPNATAIDLSNGNSLILEFPFFLGCEKCVELDTFAFLTVEPIAMVGCGDGVECNDVGTATIIVGQWSGGQNLSGGTGFKFSGSASERLIFTSSDARPESNEFYMDITADYAGDVDISGGIFKTGGGPFFKITGGSRDQTDVDINSVNVKNVPNSEYAASMYIADTDEAPTTTIVGTPVIVAGTWTATGEDRFTVTVAGRITYTGKESPRKFKFVAKHLITPDGGNNRVYDMCLRKTEPGPIETNIVQSLDRVTADASNPKKSVQVAVFSMVTGDYVELVINQVSTPQVDATVATSSLIIF